MKQEKYSLESCLLNLFVIIPLVRKNIFPVFLFLLIFSSLADAAGVVKMKQQQAQRAQQQQAMMQQRAIQQQLLQRQMLQQQMLAQQFRQISSPASGNQTVDINVLWQQLQTSSHVWSQIADLTPKIMIVDRFIQLFGQQGVTITKSAMFYVSRIDELIARNSSLLASPFKDILMIAAISEYDFNNGQDKDALARQVLGEQAYWENRARLGI